MRDLWSIASSDKIISRISKIFTQKTFLVGGCVRDFLMQRPSKDYDLVTFNDAWELAQKSAETIGAKAFWIDKKRGVARIAIPNPNGQILVDVSAPKGPDIISDLNARDITINAIAMDLCNKKLIDPLQGVHDLRARIIRAIAEENIVSDPLRILRCVRFAVEFGFVIEPKTYKLLKKYASLLSSCAPERIRQELMTGLNCEHGSKMFFIMNDIGLTNALFPCTAKRKTFTFTSEIDSIISKIQDDLKGVKKHLCEEIEPGILRSGLLRLACFLLDVGYAYSDVRGICKALKLSRKSSRIIGLLTNPVSFSSIDGSERSFYRFIAAAEPVLSEMLLIAIASAKEKKADQEKVSALARKIWTYYKNVFLKKLKTPLLSGDEIVQITGCNPGPQVGNYLRMIGEARIDKLVSTKNEAIAYLRKIKDE